MKTEDTKGRGKGRRSWRRYRRCLHQYDHLETKKQVLEGADGSDPMWMRVDLFYCQRCLWIKERVLKSHSKEQPTWY
ncbi:hypothetical protein P4518_08090 [Geobacillus thermodenitrificans]|uniref:hypothetical protein n=1 Tax=Geobacillus thermodenitrificans TaxID=33940 RepID=UPI002E24A0BF|nr:hypothetical protein [Geobacillus thermodenitrificans]